MFVCKIVIMFCNLLEAKKQPQNEVAFLIFVVQLIYSFIKRFTIVWFEVLINLQV